jgi:hypothetical protein
MNLNIFRVILLCSALMLCISFSGSATHLRAGEITVRRDNCNSLQVFITITVFTNTVNTNVLFGGEEDWLDFGDGTRMKVPETRNTDRSDLGPGIATASFSVYHTYSGYRQYIISYSEPNRNEGVLNMDGSVNTRFYIETEINFDPYLGCNNSPQLLVPPIDRACTGVAWFHNPGAYDPDGDSLSYHMVVPFREKGTEVVNYRNPNHASYYNNFNIGNETGTGPPTFNINPVDGTIKWDAPGNRVGEYNIAFIIREWREINGEWLSTGYVRRDMQIIVDDCENDRPDLLVPKDVCVVAGTTLEATIRGIDPDNDPVKIEAYSEIFQLAKAQSPATYEPEPKLNDFVPSPAETIFKWETKCSHIKDQPYQVVFKITDKSPTGSRLVTFKTWQIRVVGPAPEWVSVLPQTNRSVDLQWASYACQNAKTIQVWRKASATTFTPDSCVTGMPSYLGFSLIKELPASQTSFKDDNNGKGLAVGVEYCYRLVAIFPEPLGGESYVSIEQCIDPYPIDEPMITGVSISKTSDTEGEIQVKWIRPFELATPGLQYELYRAEGFAGNANIIKVSGTSKIEANSDTTFFTDDGAFAPAPNTRDIVYNYRVVLYTNSSSAPLDTSEVASTVRLEALSESEKITLNWSAFVPWSNVVGRTHKVYRVPKGSTDVEDREEPPFREVNPAAQGFTTTEENLIETETYCYVVATYGSYGNPMIKDYLINFSQIICAQPSDSIPPCKPVLTVKLTDCEEFLRTAACNASSFSNTLYWRRPEVACGADVLGYKIYRAARQDASYTWLNEAGPNKDGIIRDTTFIDNGMFNTGLSTLAYCYKISAIDRSGNESELSDPICNDNCPYYELPNVFTPNADGCNDIFSAYNSRPIDGEESSCPRVEGNVFKCARFVQKVIFRVYNRWGKQVYSYESGSERTIFIDWDGRGEDGRELGTGVYYYVAEVSFDSVDPKKSNQTFKGWVHLLR